MHIVQRHSSCQRCMTHGGVWIGRETETVAAYGGYKVKDRTAKVTKRRNRMPVNGVAMKRLLIDRAAKAQNRKGD